MELFSQLFSSLRSLRRLLQVMVCAAIFVLCISLMTSYTVISSSDVIGSIQRFTNDRLNASLLTELINNNVSAKLGHLSKSIPKSIIDLIVDDTEDEDSKVDLEMSNGDGDEEEARGIDNEGLNADDDDDDEEEESKVNERLPTVGQEVHVIDDKGKKEEESMLEIHEGDSNLNQVEPKVDKESSEVDEDDKVDRQNVSRNKAAFKYVLTPENKQLVLHMLDLVHDMATSENISYFLAYGSALGSYRHHDIIPWDDDIDVLIPESQMVAFMKYWYMSQEPRLMRRPRHQIAKIYSTKSTITHQPENKDYMRYTSPYVDLFFYSESDTHIYHRKQAPQLKADIFPLQLRPFGGKMYPFPRDIRRYIETWEGINPDECYTGHFSHMTEYHKPPEEVASLPCSALVDDFPFVLHTKVRRGAGEEVCKEELVDKGNVVSTFVRSAQDISKC